MWLHLASPFRGWAPPSLPACAPTQVHPRPPELSHPLQVPQSSLHWTPVPSGPLTHHQAQPLVLSLLPGARRPSPRLAPSPVLAPSPAPDSPGPGSGWAPWLFRVLPVPRSAAWCPEAPSPAHTCPSPSPTPEHPLPPTHPGLPSPSLLQSCDQVPCPSLCTHSSSKGPAAPADLPHRASWHPGHPRDPAQPHLALPHQQPARGTPPCPGRSLLFHTLLLCQALPLGHPRAEAPLSDTAWRWAVSGGC